MNITDFLVEKAGGLFTVQDEINDWTGKHFHMANTGSVEIETAEFLYGLVRITKPIKILDTGSHYGISALYMAQALIDNGLDSAVVSIEHDKSYLDKAKELWVKTGVSSYIVDAHGASLDYEPKGMFDLMLLDTEPQIRFAELEKFFPNLSPGGFVFIHDLHRHLGQEKDAQGNLLGVFGKLPEHVEWWIRHGELKPFHFPTPRGLAGFYKPREDDYHA